jgi:hypothetical protein
VGERDKASVCSPGFTSRYSSFIITLSQAAYSRPPPSVQPAAFLIRSRDNRPHCFGRCGPRRAVVARRNCCCCRWSSRDRRRNWRETRQGGLLLDGEGEVAKKADFVPRQADVLNPD